VRRGGGGGIAHGAARGEEAEPDGRGCGEEGRGRAGARAAGPASDDGLFGTEFQPG
jgi:hypothetical protein